MWMGKAFQFFILFVAVMVALAEPPSSYGPPGFSSGFRPSSGLANGRGGNAGDAGSPDPFSFKYEVKDAQSGNDFAHQANSDGRKVQGEYQVLLPDGRRQIVKYTADDNGYNADVSYDGQARGGFSGGSGGSGYSKGGSGGFGGYSY